MASTQLMLDVRGKASDGKGAINIRLYHNKKMALIPTGFRVAKKNFRNGRVTGIPEAPAINAALQNQKADIDKKLVVLSMEPDFDVMTATQVKQAVIGSRPKPKAAVRHSAKDLFAEYVKSSGLKERTREIYDTTLRKLESFSGEGICIEDMDLKWLKGFDMFMARTLSANGRAIYMRSLRSVYNYAKNTGIDCPYPFNNFRIKHEETRKRSILLADLQKFYKYPVNPAQKIARDYFFLSFFLIGINTKDLLLAKKSQVSGGRLEYVREKTGKKYSIKIEPEAQRLIDEYAGKGEYLLEAMDHNQHYRSFAHFLNDTLKEIGETTVEEIPDQEDLFGKPQLKKKINPVIPGITTYYARHTWATLAYELGISMDVISQALGHTIANRTTLIYVKFDQKKVDDANRKVIDYLLGK